MRIREWRIECEKEGRFRKIEERERGRVKEEREKKCEKNK